MSYYCASRRWPWRWRHSIALACLRGTLRGALRGAAVEPCAMEDVIRAELYASSTSLLLIAVPSVRQIT